MKHGNMKKWARSRLPKPSSMLLLLPVIRFKLLVAPNADGVELYAKCSDSGSEPNNMFWWSGAALTKSHISTGRNSILRDHNVPLTEQGFFTHSLHNLRVQMVEGPARSPDFYLEDQIFVPETNTEGGPAWHLLCLHLQVPCSCALTHHLWFSHYN